MPCPVINPEPCTWEGKQEECPNHGIGAWYRRREREQRAARAATPFRRYVSDGHGCVVRAEDDDAWG